MNISHIYIDMDGVLADFCGAAFRCHGHNYDHDTYPRNEWEIAKVLGVTMDEFWKPIDDAGIEYWANLEPLPWAADLLKLCEGVCKSREAPLPKSQTPQFGAAPPRGRTRRCVRNGLAGVLSSLPSRVGMSMPQGRFQPLFLPAATSDLALEAYAAGAVCRAVGHVKA